ncbi:MAG: hypothetical protein RLZZ338_1430 [Cyanobacteriota bacterium]|jgi:hypothetical protein
MLCKYQIVVGTDVFTHDTVEYDDATDLRWFDTHGQNFYIEGIFHRDRRINHSVKPLTQLELSCVLNPCKDEDIPF